MENPNPNPKQVRLVSADGSVQEPGNRSLGRPRTTTSRRRAQFQAAANVVRQYPSTAAIPLVLLVLALALGLWGVIWGANREADMNRARAQAVATSVGATLSLHLQQVISVFSILGARIDSQAASWQQLRTAFVVASSSLAKLSNNASLGSVALAPQGQGTYFVTGSGLGDVPDGHDFFAAGAPYRDVALYAISHRVSTILAADVMINDREAIVYLTPVYVLASTALAGRNGTAAPYVPTDVPKATNCSVCADQIGQYIFWGLMYATSWVDEASDLNHLQQAGYRYCLEGTSDTQASIHGSRTLYADCSATSLHDPITVAVRLDNSDTQWKFSLSPSSGTWQPPWEWPLVATVIVLSFGLTVLQFWAMMAWHEHKILLESLLPANVLQELRNDNAYQASPFEIATDTPAATMLRIVTQNLQHEPPDVSDLVIVRTALLRNEDVYKPLDLGEKIKAANLDDDVMHMLLHQLASSDHLLMDDAWRSLASMDGVESFTGDEDAAGAQPLRAVLATMMVKSSDMALSRMNSRNGRELANVVGAVSRRRKESKDSVQLEVRQIPQLLVQDVNFDGSNGMATDQQLMMVAQALASEAGPPGSVDGGILKGGGVVSNQAAGKTRRVSILNENGKWHLQALDVARGSSHSDLPARSTGSGDAADGAEPAPERRVIRAMSRRASHTILDSLSGPILDEVELQLGRACTEWQFDTMALAAATQGHPLSTLGFYILSTSGLLDRFKLKRETVARYLCRIEALYKDNPYHNATHAADVLQTMHMLLTRGRVAESYADPLSQLACYIAAIVHDVGHPGRTNDFLCATSDDLAVLYNDKAPLENHHVSSAFAVLKRPGLDFLAPLPREERVSLRRMVIELVLATDMKQHFSLIAQFKTLFQLAAADAAASVGGAGGGSFKGTSITPPPMAATLADATRSGLSGTMKRKEFGEGKTAGTQRFKTLRINVPSHSGAVSLKSPMPRTGSARTPGRTPITSTTGKVVPEPTAGMPISAAKQASLQRQLTNSLPELDEAGRILTLQMALKCADIGHLGAPLNVHLKWVANLEEEFFRQGDEEREAGLAISALFDRSKPGVTKSQVGFFDFVVLPLFRAVVAVLPDSEPLLDAVEYNYQHWVDKQPAPTK